MYEFTYTKRDELLVVAYLGNHKIKIPRIIGMSTDDYNRNQSLQWVSTPYCKLSKSTDRVYYYQTNYIDRIFVILYATILFNDEKYIFSLAPPTIESLIRTTSDNVLMMRNIVDYNRRMSTNGLNLISVGNAAKFCDINVSNDGNITLSFHKIKCGNDNEGYIHYKSIDVKLSNSLNPVSFRFYFNRFYADSADGLYWHPHCGDDSICWGDNVTEYELFRGAANLEMIAMMIKEALASYNPGNPYLAVKHIANRVSCIDKYCRQNDISSINMNQISVSNLTKCPRCGDYLGENGNCASNNCMNNPSATNINCPVCGFTITYDHYDEDNGHIWRCDNKYCYTSPNYEPVFLNEFWDKSFELIPRNGRELVSDSIYSPSDIAEYITSFLKNNEIERCPYCNDYLRVIADDDDQSVVDVFCNCETYVNVNSLVDNGMFHIRGNKIYINRDIRRDREREQQQIHNQQQNGENQNG